MKTAQRIIRPHTFILATLIVVTTTSCLPPFRHSTPRIHVQLAGNARQNLENDRANSVVVRIYQLTASEKFEGRSLQDFVRNDSLALGDQLVERRQVTLLPNSAETISIALKKQTRFVGVWVDLIQPAPATAWRRVWSLKDIKGNRLMINIGSHQFSFRPPANSRAD